MAQLTIHLFGSLQILIGGSQAKGFDSDKVRALLAYLVVSADQPQRRDLLAGLLWPNAPQTVARTNLRRGLANLRHVLGDHQANPPFLHINRQTIQFNSASDAWVDVVAFAKLLAEEPNTTHLAQAAELYRGSFLAGFGIDDSVAFDEWLLLRREQLQRQATAVLHHLAQLYEQQHAYEQALPVVWRLVELEPWDEQGQRRLLRLLALTGQRTAALSQYEACRQTLADELGVAPERATRELYEQIRDGKVVAQKEAETAVLPLSSLLQPPAFFAGRQQELAQLADYLAAGEQGQGGVVFVTGEAGSGKTLLLQAFAQQAQRANAQLVVAGGECNAQAGVGDPYLPFRTILDLLLHHMPLAVTALLEHGPDLVETFVSGAVLQTAVSPHDPLYPQVVALVARQTAVDAPSRQQQDLFAQYGHMLQAISQKQPLLLLLDDLQWADVGSINLLFHLGRQIDNCAILIVGAYRPEEVAWGRTAVQTLQQERHPLLPVVHELQRAFGDIEVALNRAAGRPFINDLLDAAPNHLDTDFRARLYEQTEGHALFTAELLEGLREQGDLWGDADGYWVANPVLDWTMMPARVEAIIAERIGRLPQPLRHLLSIASIEGETFTAELIAAITQDSEQDIVQQLSGALARQHRLVYARGSHFLGEQRLSHYRFRHALFQQYLYNRLDDVERAYLHEMVGNVVEAWYADLPKEGMAVTGELARHFRESGRLDKAIVYYQQAGDRAVRLVAHAEAIDHYRQALALLAQLPPSSARDQQEIGLQLALGVPLLSLYGYADPAVAKAYERTRQLCEQAGNGPELVMALFWLTSFYTVRGELAQGLALGEQMVQVAEQTKVNDFFLLSAHLLTGFPLFFMGRFADALVHFEQVAAIYQPDQHQDFVYQLGQDPGISALSWIGHTKTHMGHLAQARTAFEQARKQARALGHPLTLAFTLHMGGVSPYAFAFEEWETAVSFGQELLQLADEKGFASFQMWGNFHLGLARAHLALSQPGPQAGLLLTEGIGQMQQGIQLYLQSGSELSLATSYILLAGVYQKAGNLDAGLDCLAKAAALIVKNGERYFEPELYRLQGELHLQKGGDPGAAERHFYQALDLARQQQSKLFELRAALSLACLWQQQGNGDAAQGLLAGIYDWFSEGLTEPDLRRARAFLDKQLRENGYECPSNWVLCADILVK